MIPHNPIASTLLHTGAGWAFCCLSLAEQQALIAWGTGWVPSEPNDLRRDQERQSRFRSTPRLAAGLARGVGPAAVSRGRDLLGVCAAQPVSQSRSRRRRLCLEPQLACERDWTTLRGSGFRRRARLRSRSDRQTRAPSRDRTLWPEQYGGAPQAPCKHG